jgi:hypothetical protein
MSYQILNALCNNQNFSDLRESFYASTVNAKGQMFRGIFIVGGDIIIDGADELIDVLKDSATDALLRDLGEPAIHLIEPGATGRRENGGESAGASGTKR